MKVFFAASVRGTEQFGAFYKRIYDEIRSLGFTHVDDDSVKLTYEEMLEKGRTNPKYYADYTAKKIKSVQDSDICVFEVSEPNMGVGFLVERALQFGKPVLVLYYKNHLPFMFSGIEDDKFILKNYNEKNLKKILHDALTQAKERRDRRFNFFINPKLLDYIDTASQKQGITKSKFIRNLILEHMHRGPDA